MYEIFEQLLQKYGVTPYKISKETGITQSTLSDWKRGKSTPKQDKLQKIADYFGVPLSYLLTGKMEEEIKESTLTPKDERDIAKNLEKMMNDLKDNKDGPLYFNGEEIDDTSAELLAAAFDSALRQMKIINKVKYNPNKNKKK